MNYFNGLRAAGKPVAYYAKLAKPLGGATCAVLFSQLLYWHDKTDCELGTYKTVADIENETGLTPREQETACKKLCALGVLVKTHKRLQHRMYYRLDETAFNRVMAEFEAQNGAVGETANDDLANTQNAVSRTDKNAVRETAKCGLVESTKAQSVKGTLDYQENTNIDYLHKGNAQDCATNAPNHADGQTETVKPAKAKKSDRWTQCLTLLLDAGVDNAVAQDHIAIRKANGKLLTPTALAGLQREAAKAGLTLTEALRFATEWNWYGFRADWFAKRMGFADHNGFTPTVRQVSQVAAGSGGIIDPRTGQQVDVVLDVNPDEIDF